MKKITNIIILAGGDGDRFWPLKNKLLTSFLGIPLLLRIIDGVIPYGERIFVVCNKENSADMEKFVGAKAALVIQDENRVGMGGAVLSCKGKLSGDTLVLGNDIFSLAQVEMLKAKMEGKTELVFLARKMLEYFPGGYLELKDGTVKGIVEKPEPSKTPSDLVKLVADYFRNIDGFIAVLESMNVDSDDQYERAVDKYIKDGKVDYVVYEGQWNALKYAWNVLGMSSFFLSGMDSTHLDSTAMISKSAVIGGHVFIGKNAKVGDFVKISGPCYIGDNTIVADYALVRESHIGNNCLIGSSTEVARSYLGDSVSLHRNYVGDSVLADGVLFGAGAVTANFRFDEGSVMSTVNKNRINTNSTKLGAIIGKRSKVGVNSTLYPGVKIGSGALVAPSETVTRDLEDNAYLIKGEVRIKK